MIKENYKSRKELLGLILIPLAIMLLFTLGLSQALPLFNQGESYIQNYNQTALETIINPALFLVIALIALFLISGIFEMIVNLDKI